MYGSMLHQVVIRELTKGSRTGYELCTNIGRATGRRPSYGSIYPILERLANEENVTVRQDGRRKIYTLTPKGKRAAEELRKNHERLINEEMVRIKKVMSLLDVDPDPMLAILERARKGEPPLGAISSNMFRFRDTVFRMVHENKVDHHAKEINTMLTQMTKKLERMT